MKIRIITLIILCLGVLQSADAQRRCRVFGTVKDEVGAPIELAAVRQQGTAVATVTSLKGTYSLTVPCRDTVTIVYSMIGYESRKRLVSTKGCDSLRIDVMLPTYGAMLGEAVVVGQNVQTGTTIQIKPTDTSLTPSASGNGVEDIIATQAGVSTHNELSSQYNVRGGSYDENVVYLNGVEVYRPMLVRSGNQEGLSIINSDMVEGIAFSSGGFEARYGDKMSSVLDITYKRPEKFEAKAAVSILGGSAYVGWGNKKVSLMASVRYKTTKYLLSSLDTNGEYDPNFLDYQMFMSWRPNKRWSFDVLINFSDNTYNFKPADRETNFGTMEEAKSFKVYFDGQEKDQFRTAFAAATLTRHFNPDTYLALQFSTFGTKESETYDISGQYWLQEATSQEQLGVGTYMEHARNRLRANVYDVGLRFRTKLTGHILQAGADWRREIITENAREWEMRDSMGYSLPHSPEELRLIYALRAQTDISTNRFEVYAQDTWRIHSGIGLFNLTYGVRLSHWDWNNETILSPRASLGFLPSANEKWTMRFATGYYYQAPFYKELRDTLLQNGIANVALNRNIKSQRSIHFVLGADYTFRLGNRPFRFTAEAYYKHLSNLIPYSVDNMRVVYYGRNCSDGYATGVDFKIFGEFVLGTDSWLTFSLMKTQERLDGKWLPRPTDQRYNISLYFTDYFPGTTRWTVTLRAAIAGGLPFGPPHTDRARQTFRAPAYKRVDIGLNYCLLRNDDEHRYSGIWRAFKSIWLGVDAFNILGIYNTNSYYWVTDITNTQYAVPNYLTGRQINARLSIAF